VFHAEPQQQAPLSTPDYEVAGCCSYNLLSPTLQSGSPLSDDPGHLDKYILLAFAGAFESAEAVVGIVQQMKGRAFTEFFADRFEKLQVGRFIARAGEAIRKAMPALAESGQ
jgi:hypothetical protein